MENANVGSIVLRATGKNEDSAGDDEKSGAYSTGNYGQGRRRVGFTEDESHRARTSGDAMKLCRRWA